MSDAPQPSLQPANQMAEYRCIIRIKQTFQKVADVWRVISFITPANMITTQMNSQTHSDWLQKFSISRNSNGEFSISYDIERCDANNLSEDHYSDDGIRSRIKELGLESDIVQITRKHVDENEVFNDMIASTQLHTDSDLGKRNYHYRRNAANAINPTPILVPDWMTLTTSTIIPSTDDSQPSEHDPLSRILIPSMTSPTIVMISTSIPNADPIENSILSGHEHRHHRFQGGKYHTPFIYTTPVLGSERPTIIEGHEDLFTPIPVTQTPSLRTSQLVSDTLVIAPSPSIVPVITTSQIEVTTEDEKTTTSPVEMPEKAITPFPMPNKTPYINKRIRKLELIAGKYWKYTIPSDTFVDFEDGDTRKLKLTFLMSSSTSTQEQPPTNYWIQFDHENQYLYALTTEDDVGKHYFNLVAVDSSGAHVTETLEVHVRQHKNTRAFTHMFTLSNVSWDPFQFACLIEATSSLLKRVTTRIFGDSNILTVAVQKITLNEKDSTWYENHFVLTLFHVFTDLFILSNFRTISWTNDTLPTHPCPRDMIQDLYAKLHDPDKIFDDSSAEPSRLLRQTLSPEFRVHRVQLNFITKSACGSYEIPDIDDKTKTKEVPVFRNRIGKLGPFRVGEAFKFKIPEDTVFSPSRQVGTRELALSLRAIEPPQMPDLIYFDSEEQEIYGLALSSEQVKSYELNLIAEDTISGGTANDIFTIEIIDEIRDQSKQHLFEIFINLLGPPGRDELTIRDKVDIVHHISSGILRDGDASAVAILSIKKFQYDGLAQGFTDDSNYLDSEPIENNELDGNRQRRNHRHQHHETAPKHRHARDSNAQYYYEYKWTNRTIVGHEKCPKELILNNIYNRIFERDYDSLKVLKEIFEPNYDLINVEFQPMGVCKDQLTPKVMGPRPIPVTSPPSTVLIPTQPTSKEDEDADNAIDIDESNEFLLTTIIPPVAILIALIFAAIVGCCFHRANKRRKSVEISTRLPGDPSLNEREAFLQKGRIPIIFEFEQQQQQQQQHVSPQQQQQYNLITPVIMPPSQQQQQQQQHNPPQQVCLNIKSILLIKSYL